jgi:hypothetical protein
MEPSIDLDVQFSCYVTFPEPGEQLIGTVTTRSFWRQPRYFCLTSNMPDMFPGQYGVNQALDDTVHLHDPKSKQSLFHAIWKWFDSLPARYASSDEDEE